MSTGVSDFLLHEWIFSVKNSQDFMPFRSSPTNRSEGSDASQLKSAEIIHGFNFDWNTLDWYTYINYFCYGIHRYILGMYYR